MKYAIFIVSLLIGFTSTVKSQQIVSYLDTNVIAVGQQTYLNVNVLVSATDTVEWFVLSDTLDEHIEILESYNVDTSYTKDDITIKQLNQRFLITSFDSGYYPIKPVEIIVNGNPFKSEPLLLAVQSFEVDTSKGIADIYNPTEIPFSWKEWVKENWPWVAGTFACLGLFTLIVFLISRTKKIEKPIRIIKIPEKPAHEIALEKLHELVQEKLWQKNKTKAYYTKLADIIREYLENRYGIYALEETTHQIAMLLKPYILDQVAYNRIVNVLQTADLVKFAKLMTIATENDANIKAAFEFIEATKQLKVEIPVTEPETQING